MNLRRQGTADCTGANYIGAERGEHHSERLAGRNHAKEFSIEAGEHMLVLQKECFYDDSIRFTALGGGKRIFRGC